MRKKIVLAVGAHPDDIDFLAGGTIAKLSDEGNDVYYLICTDGSRGSENPGMTHTKLAKIRHEEQIEAGKVLGIRKVFFLNYKDTQLVSDLKLKKEICEIIKKVKPNIIITMDPAFYYSEKFGFVNHTDHREAAQAAMDACFPLSRDRLTFPDHEREGLKPHKTDELWLVSVEQKKTLVDISETFNKKLKAISMHKSQFPDFQKTKRKVEEHARYFGKMFGVKYAESFAKIRIAS